MAEFQPSSSMSASLNNPAAEAVSTPVDIRPPQVPISPANRPQRTGLQEPMEQPTQDLPATEPVVDMATPDGIRLDGPAPEAEPVDTPVEQQEEVNPFDAPGMVEGETAEEVNPFDAPGMVEGEEEAKPNALIKAVDDANMAMKNAINPDLRDEYGQPRAATITEAIMKPLNVLGAVFQELGVGYEAALTTAGMDESLAKQLSSFIAGAGTAGGTPKTAAQTDMARLTSGGGEELAKRAVAAQMEQAFNKIPETKQAAAQTAIENKIPIYQYQISDSPVSKAVASTMKDIPLSGAVSRTNKQVEAFNKAVLKTVGEEGDTVTPEVLEKVDLRLGKVFEDTAQKYSLPVTPEFKQALREVQKEAQSNLIEGQLTAVRSQIKNIMSKVNNDEVIPGKAVQKLRSNIGRLLRSQHSSPELGRLQDTLDDFFMKTMSPEDAAAISEARKHYRNMLVLEKVVSKNMNEPMSPAKLQGAVSKTYGDYAYVGENTSDIEKLARLGNVISDAFPNSGTAQRSAVYKFLTGALGGGAGAAAAITNLPATIGTAATAAGISRYGITPTLYKDILNIAARGKQMSRMVGKEAVKTPDRDNIIQELVKQTGITEAKADDFLTRVIEVPENMEIHPDTRLMSMAGFDMRGVKTEKSAVKTPAMLDKRSIPSTEPKK